MTLNLSSLERGLWVILSQYKQSLGLCSPVCFRGWLHLQGGQGHAANSLWPSGTRQGWGSGKGLLLCLGSGGTSCALLFLPLSSGPSLSSYLLSALQPSTALLWPVRGGP